jgi:hypothetical protein
MLEDYDKIEKMFKKLITQMRGVLSGEEQREIIGYIDTNDFEAALEALVDILAEKAGPLPKPCIQEAGKLAKALEMPGEFARIQKELAKKTG